MQKLYHVFPRAISPEVCNQLVNRGMSLPAQEASIGFDNDRIENSYRVSTIRWFYGPENKDIVDLVTQHATFANREYFGFDISYGPHEFQFTEYHGNRQGKYDWHHDVWWTNPRAHDRKVTVSIQLSPRESYTGGDFEFRSPDDYSAMKDFAHQGSILVFPSFMEHRVSPVLTGTRYSLVSWVDGPKFR